DAGRHVAENKHAAGDRFKKNSVGAALRIDAFDPLHLFRVEHADGIAAAEAVMRFRIDGDAVAADVGDGADEFVVVEAEHVGLSPARNIDATRVVVGEDIIDAAATHYLGGVEDFIGRVG